MKKFMSAQPFAVDFGLLLLRVLFGVMMAFIGFAKLSNFTETATGFKDIHFLGMSGTPVLCLVIFAEFFCALLLILGFLTRLSLIPLIICMAYIVIIIDGFNIHKIEFGTVHINEAFMYLMVFVSFLFTGPGKYSVDHLISKR